MKRLFPLLLTLLLFPLPGCGLGNGIPRGLDWQALTVTDQKGGALLSAAPGWEGERTFPVSPCPSRWRQTAWSSPDRRPESNGAAPSAPGEALSDGHYRLPPVLPRRRGRLGGVWYHRAHRWQPGGRPLSHCRGCDGLLYRPTF